MKKIYTFILFCITAMTLIGCSMSSASQSNEKVSTYVTIQVNPAFSIGIDQDNKVVEVQSLNEDAEQIINNIDAEEKSLEETLQIIKQAMIDQGIDISGKEIVLAVSAKNDLTEATVIDLNNTVSNNLSEGNDNHTTVVQLPNNLHVTLIEKGFLPGDYADLVEENISEQNILQILEFQEEIGVDEEIFRDELSTIASDYADMLESGINEEDAMIVLETALTLDASLEELSTIVSAVIDMHDEGIEVKDGLESLQKAEELGVEKETLLDESSTITSAQADLVEAGISTDNAKKVIQEAMKYNTNLEELETITSAYIDLVDEGHSQSKAIDKLIQAIQKDPSLDNLDDLLFGDE
jgi:tetratricopeptide (TPR) repeat protein